MFNLLRHYAITSFISILVAAVLLAGLYRHLQFQEAIELAHTSDLAIAGIASIMLLLYGVLFVSVQRAKAIVETQQASIRERTHTLETLFAQLLKNEEKEKEELATGLHEDLAQTLSAIKIRIENSLGQRKANVPSTETLSSAVSALQGVIEELQQTAMELRPPSLEELGLLPTIRWFCREFENVHTGIRIEQKISVQEEQIPAPLRIVIYRIIESALNEIARSGHTNQVRLALRLTADAITVGIEYIPQDPAFAAPANRDRPPAPLKRFVVAQERISQSGGTFLTAQNKEGGIALQAYWADSVEFVRSQSRKRYDPASAAGAPRPGNRISPPTAAQIRPEAA